MNNITDQGIKDAASLDSVASYICRAGGWAINNAKLQKIVYFAQMFHIGKTNGSRLVNTTFEAWYSGPVSPELYKKVQMFGSEPIANVFYNACTFYVDDDRMQTLDEVCKSLLPKCDRELIAMSRSSRGAWAKTYVYGANPTITDAAIQDEYNEWLR